jgi:putative chitinase
MTHMTLTIDHVKKIARGKLNASAIANAKSVLLALEVAGSRFGLNQPHRLAQFLAQIMHESGEFRFDREVWGPSPAQKRYEGRKDLGNTQPGDGARFKGHTSMQITGRANTKAFRDWCRKNVDAACPDFLKQPELMNADPWEGLGPIWYWDTRKLNRLADQGDVENITEKINGGLNGYADRVTLLGRASLVLLGYAPDAVKKFQGDHAMDLIDGKPGPKTRAAMHVALVGLTAGAMAKQSVTSAPVVETVETTIIEEKPVAVAPPAIDKPVEQTTGFWERITSIVGSGSLAGLAWLGDVDWKTVAAISGGLILLALAGLFFHNRIVNAVREIKREIAA